MIKKHALAVLSALVLVAASVVAHAQGYPNQPIRLIVRERTKQHRVDERKECGRGRDAKSEEERDADRDSGRSHERAQCLCDVVPRSDEDEIPDQRQPGRRKREAPTRMSRFEQALAVVANGLPLLAVANAKDPEQLRITPGAPPQEAIGRHAR